MPRPSLLVFLRHAESARNVAKKGNVFFADDESRRSLRGVADHNIPITEEGRRQAERTGHSLRERFGRFDVLYHSGYRRTIDTAEGVLRAYPADERGGWPVRCDTFIRERDAGFAYDMTSEEARTAFPYLDEYWRTTGSFFSRPPGGESVAQVCERAALFLNRLESLPEQRILIVTHGVVLRAFRFLLENWDYATAEEAIRNEAPENCSVTVYESGIGGYLLREYNSVYWR
jgi:broad specificity phosphatase PhoE